MSHEVPHTAQPLHLQPSKRVPSPANPRQQLFDSYEQCREQEEAVQKAKSKNAELPGQLWTQEETSQERDSELRDKNKSLERELQSSEKNRKKLGQQLILLRSEHESILQENGKLREQNKSLSQDNRKVFNNNASLVDRLETLEPEVDTLRKAVACLEREKALMKEDYLGRCTRQLFLPLEQSTCRRFTINTISLHCEMFLERKLEHSLISMRSYAWAVCIQSAVTVMASEALQTVAETSGIVTLLTININF